MIASGTGGSVANTSSIAGSVGICVALACSAAKAGARILSKGAALEYATQGIRVNTIHPGLIATPMVAEQPDQTALVLIEIAALPVTEVEDRVRSGVIGGQELELAVPIGLSR